MNLLLQKIFIISISLVAIIVIIGSLLFGNMIEKIASIYVIGLLSLIGITEWKDRKIKKRSDNWYWTDEP